MPYGRDREKLREIVAEGVAGLRPELLDHLPRPLSAPPVVAIEGASAAEIEARELQRIRQEIADDRTAETDEERDARAKALAAARTYIIPDELLHAIQVALLLRQPLLLTGDPGVGKTRFARALAGLLGVPCERIDVKTTTSGRDLLYAVDDIARFRDAAGNRGVPGSAATPRSEKSLKDYVVFSGMGRAILRAAGPGYLVTPKVPIEDIAGPQHAGKTSITLGELFPQFFTRGRRMTGARGHSVVLVDELDKAPRDTPNDLLVEIEEMVMYIHELGFEVRATPYFWPIVIITSNSERSLPDPFLRRCAFHNLKLDDAMLPQIIAAQLPDLPQPSALVAQVIKLFQGIRTDLTLEKKPSTAELVSTVALLIELGFDPTQPVDLKKPELRGVRQQIAAALGKVTDDKSKVADRLARM